MPHDPQTLRRKLEELKGTPKGEYSQGEAIVRAGGQADVSGGACTGTCVDWLRRVMQSELKHAYSDTGGKTRRAMAAHAALEEGAPARETARYGALKSKIESFTATRKDTLASERTTLLGDQAALQKKYDVAWAAFESCMDPGQRRTLLDRANAIGAGLDRLEAEIKRNATDYGTAQDKAQSALDKVDRQRAEKSPVHRTWDDFTGIMQAQGGKSFNGLAVVISVPTGGFATGGHLAVALIRSGSLTSGRGALLDVSPGATGPGHTIAAYHMRNGQILLFDPNLGTYAFDQNGFMRAVHMLYSEGYDNCRQSDGGIRASYTIFGGDAAEPTVRPPITASVLSGSSAAAAAAAASSTPGRPGAGVAPTRP